MKVAHLDTGRAWRGGQAQVWRLVAGLKARGHEAMVLAPPGPLLARVAAMGVAARAWEAGNDWDWIARHRAWRLLRDDPPEVLHAHDARAHTVAAWVGARLNVPVVVTRRSLGGSSPSPWTRRKYGRGIDRYLCLSRAVAAGLRAAGVAEARLTRVPSGIDRAALEAARADPGGARIRSLVAAPPGAPVVGTVAALTAEKGVDAFVRAAAVVRRRHPETRWVWIGDGPRRAALERAAAAAGVGDRVVPLGFRDDVPWLVRDLTLFVSASDHEGLGTAVLEAQALGVPVVATRSGGVEDAIEDGVSGRLTSADALGDAVVAALDDAHAAAAWARAAHDRVAAFDVGAMVDATLEVYREVVAERAGR